MVYYNYKKQCVVYAIRFFYEKADGKIHKIDPELVSKPSSRALRLVQDTKRFCWISFHRNIPNFELKPLIERLVKDGISVEGNM